MNEWKQRKKIKWGLGEGGSVRRDGENWALREREWGNIFHFPFPSSPCQDINHYPLKLIPSLCRGIEGKWRRAVYYWPSWLQWNGLKVVENFILVRATAAPQNAVLVSHSTLFGQSNLRRFQTRQTGLDSLFWVGALNTSYITISADLRSLKEVITGKRSRFNVSVLTLFYRLWLLTVYHAVFNSELIALMLFC